MTIHHKLLLLYFLIFPLSKSFCQSVFVKIIDFETGYPISDVKISNSQNEELIPISNNGTFLFDAKKLWNGAVYTLNLEKPRWELLNENDLVIQQDTLLLVMVNSEDFTLKRVKLADSLGSFTYRIYEESLRNVDSTLSTGIAFAKFRNIHKKMTEQIAGFNYWNSSVGIQKVFQKMWQGEISLAIELFDNLPHELSAGYLILETYIKVLKQNYDEIEISDSLIPILNQNDLIAQRESLQLIRVLELKLSTPIVKLVQNKDVFLLYQVLMDMDEKCFCGNEFESPAKAKKMIEKLSKTYEQLNLATEGLFFHERIELAILFAKFESYKGNMMGFEKRLSIAHKLANELKEKKSFRYYEAYRDLLTYEADYKSGNGRYIANKDFSDLNEKTFRFFKQHLDLLINQELTFHALLFNLRYLNSENSKTATYKVELDYWKEKVTQKYPRAYNSNYLNELKNQILHSIQDRDITESEKLLALYSSELELRPAFYFYDKVRDQKFYHLHLGKLQFMQGRSSEGMESYFRYFDLWKIYDVQYKREFYEYVQKIYDLTPLAPYTKNYLSNLERLLAELNYVQFQILNHGYEINDSRIDDLKAGVINLIELYKVDLLKSKIENTEDLDLKIKLTEDLVALKVEIVNINYQPRVFVSYARDLGDLAFLNLIAKEYEMAELYARRALEHPNFVLLKDYRDEIIDINLTLVWALTMLNEEELAQDIFKNLKAKNKLMDLKPIALEQLETLEKEGIDLSKFDFLLSYFE